MTAHSEKRLSKRRGKSQSSHRKRRPYAKVACDRCRSKKLRCVSNSDIEKGVVACERCKRAHVECVYSITTTTTTTAKSNPSQSHAQGDDVDDSDVDVDDVPDVRTDTRETIASSSVSAPTSVTPAATDATALQRHQTPHCETDERQQQASPSRHQRTTSTPKGQNYPSNSSRAAAFSSPSTSSSSSHPELTTSSPTIQDVPTLSDPPATVNLPPWALDVSEALNAQIAEMMQGASVTANDCAASTGEEEMASAHRPTSLHLQGRSFNPHPVEAPRAVATEEADCPHTTPPAPTSTHHHSNVDPILSTERSADLHQRFPPSFVNPTLPTSPPGSNSSLDWRQRSEPAVGRHIFPPESNFNSNAELNMHNNPNLSSHAHSNTTTNPNISTSPSATTNSLHEANLLSPPHSLSSPTTGSPMHQVPNWLSNFDCALLPEVTNQSSTSAQFHSPVSHPIPTPVVGDHAPNLSFLSQNARALLHQALQALPNNSARQRFLQEFLQNRVHHYINDR